MKRLVILAVFAVTIAATFAFAQNGGRGNRLFADDFATFVNRWETIDAQDTSVQYDTQALHFVFTAQDTEAVSQPSNPINLPRFIMQANVAFTDDSATDGFGGIVFGYQDSDNYYVYGIQPTGHYEVRLRIDGEWRDPLVKGFYEETTGVVLLSIQYDAGRYVLFINEEVQVPFFDDTLEAGEFGLYANAGASDTHVIFDDFEVYDLVYEDTESAADQLTVSGTIANGTVGSTVDSDLLTVDVVAAELIDGQPTGNPIRQSAVIEDNEFSVEALPITDNTVVFAEVTYDGVIYYSQFIPVSEISESFLDLPVTVFDATDDLANLRITGAWYIVGASPDEGLAEIFMWYFVENTSNDMTLRDISIALPTDAFSISVDSAIPDRFEVDSQNLQVIDHAGLYPEASDIYQITYLLPYEDESLSFEHSPNLEIDEVNVFVARVFDLSFTGEGFEDRGVIPIRGLGDYSGYRLETPLQVGETLSFTITGGPLLGTETAPTETPQATPTNTPQPPIEPSSTPDPDAPTPTPVETVAPPRI